MSILRDVYHKSIEENEKNLHFWEDYLRNLQNLNLQFYTNLLKVPALVPIGKRIFFRGNLIHTNEVTVPLGASYFAKCSTVQAEELRQHRIADAVNKIKLLKTEREYIENQISFTGQSLFENNSGHEIVEPFEEQEENLWRIKHKDNVKKHKHQKTDISEPGTITDEELWNRLEELELQEELEQEYLSMKQDIKCNDGDVVNLMCSNNNSSHVIVEKEYQERSPISKNELENVASLIESSDTENDILYLKEIIDKQSSLREQLLAITNREKVQAKTKEEIIAHIEEMEELESIEDEMNRIDDALDDEHTNDETNVVKKTQHKKNVSFADDAETAQLNFSHSDVKPSIEPYDPKKGITKPSDVYAAFNNFASPKVTVSIVKKSVYANEDTIKEQKAIEDQKEIQSQPSKTIILKDITEKPKGNGKIVDKSSRPQSLFKMHRAQNKS